MNHTSDPNHQFVFADTTGTTYTRDCYWESLYVFKYGQERILVADRIVPNTNLHEALYQAFRSKQGDTLSHRLLPETIQTPLLNIVTEDQALQPFVESVASLVPSQNQTLPDELLKKTEELLEETATQTLIERGIEGGLGSFDTNDTTSFLSDEAPPGGALNTLSQSEREDAQLLNLSIQVDAAIKQQLRDLMKDNALVLHGDPEFNLLARLYTNPRYLAFVRRVLKAKGSYVSPVIRDFLSFYNRCLNIKLNTHAHETNTDIDTIKKRLESTLGREKVGQHHAFDYHALTILGFIQKGNPILHTEDPDQTDYSYKIDPNTSRDNLELLEISDNRFLIQKFVHHTFNTHHNVRDVTFIDEATSPPEPSRITLPDPIEKAIQSKIARFDEWLGENKTQIMSAGIGWLVFALILTLGIVIFGLLKGSGYW